LEKFRSNLFFKKSDKYWLGCFQSITNWYPETFFKETSLFFPKIFPEEKVLFFFYLSLSKGSREVFKQL